MKVQLLSRDQVVEVVESRIHSGPSRYYAMYSSLLGGVVTDPCWMMIPLDDHMVHRGDGVFEAIKFNAHGIYLLQPHLERLFESAAQIGLKSYAEISRLQEIVEATVQIARQTALIESGLLRLFMSRGPGSFSVSPYDTQGTQFFAVVTSLSPPPDLQYRQGVKVGVSRIRVKESWMARVKSCNYLPNVMMKKEAIDQHLDFMVSLDDQGFLAESSTENMVILSSDGALVRPRHENILRGTTMTRIFELAEKSCAQGSSLIRAFESRDVSLDEIKNASEIMMLGTTLDVLPVGEFAGIKKNVGPVSQHLLRLLRRDQGLAEVVIG